jgi:catechol 2,3-dioxygenase-like lactoylglutathione lyase family enzyme
MNDTDLRDRPFPASSTGGAACPAGRATDIAYVRYQVTDLARLENFLRDFGLQRVAGGDSTRLLMRGSGTAPFIYEAVPGDACRFLGAGFEVAARADLERLAALPGSGPIEPVTGVPDGGERVRMRLPDGFEIDALHGARRAPPLPARPDPGFNGAASKPRRNTAVRVQREAGNVKRLGHVVLHVTDHDASVAWLHERLGLVASDHLAAPGEPGRIVGTFLRINAGADFVDHHCLLVIGTPRAGVHHCSFEMDGLDAVMCAHDFLLERGHALDCGVGRHLLGSQVFDYWRDPFGFRIEHYTDGDVVNDEHRPCVFAGAADETTQWGAKPPQDFFE